MESASQHTQKEVRGAADQSNAQDSPTEKWRKFRELIEPEIDAKRPKLGQEDWGNEPLPPKEKNKRKKCYE